MDMMFDHVINDVEFDADDATLHGDGGVVCGILLSSRGCAFMGCDNTPSTSTNW